MADVSLQSLFDQARQALEMGDADQAGAIARHALRYAPNIIEGHHLLGEAYLNGGQANQAVAAFETVLRVDPENIAAYYGLGLAQQSLGHGLGAIRAYERALEIQPNLADLRTRLLQLYAETPGSAGQFRLSRAGLGRLYARGQMFPQAIDEFRAVLDNEPERDDVRVALAEAFWRDGQEDEAADWCRDTLKRRPDLFKPTLILGYLQLAAGQAEGETLWRRAASQEPSLQTAQALFDILPPLQIEDLKVPPFDEQASRDEQARLAAAPPEPAPAMAAGTDGTFFDEAWPVNTPASAPVTPTTPPPHSGRRATLSDDDLLASLLGFDNADAGAADPSSDLEHIVPTASTSTTTSPAAPAADEIGPYVEHPDRVERAGDVQQPSASYSEPDAEDAPAQPGAAASVAHMYQAAPPAPVRTSDNDAPQPFDIDNFDDEPFPFEPGARPPSSEVGDALGSVQPFSLTDWDHQDDDNGAGDAASGASPSNAGLAGEDATPFRPFSLEELSLDALNTDHSDFLAGPSGEGSEAEVVAQDAASEQPFSSDQQPLEADAPETEANEVLLSESETVGDAALAQAPETTSNPSGSPADMAARPSDEGGVDDAEPGPTSQTPQPVPFSFADLGLDEDDFAVLEIEETSELGETQPHAPVEPAAFAEPATATYTPTGQPALLPFDLSELGLVDDEPVEALDAGDVAAPRDDPDQEEMTPFSLADLGLSDEELAQLGLGAEAEPAATQAEPATGTGTPVDQEEMTPFSLADLGFSDEELELFNATTVEDSEAHATGETSTPTPSEMEPAWGSPEIESSLAVSTGWEALETETTTPSATGEQADNAPETASTPTPAPPTTNNNHP